MTIFLIVFGDLGSFSSNPTELNAVLKSAEVQNTETGRPSNAVMRANARGSDFSVLMRNVSIVFTFLATAKVQTYHR